jgi:hypothetical protein
MKKVLTSLMVGVSAMAAVAQAPAFPGAEGFARYVTGGRGGKIVHVTNLNDKGEGSLREAVSGSAKKIVVFDVGGTIELASDLKIGSNTTIAGQTAPGPGITLRYYTVRPDANNVVIRFIRFRRGEEKDVNDGADAIWTRHYTGIMLDHCSISWSIDECASFYDNNDFTMQWCTVSESLNNPGHSKGQHGYGGIWGGKGASFHHTLLAHHTNRSPRFNGARYNWSGYDKTKYANSMEAERVDFRNCVNYNWGQGNGAYGGPGGGYHNIVNNYYKAGPSTKNKTRVFQASANSSSDSNGKIPNNVYGKFFIEGNYVTAADEPENYDWNGVIADGGKKVLDTIKLEQPTDPGVITTHSAEVAFQKVLAYAGASLARDAEDSRYMEEAANGTATYTGSVTKLAGIIDYVADVEGYRPLTETYRPENFDTDGDGMPDEWETLNGLDPNNADDGVLYTLDPKEWYTNVEVYINSIVEDIMKAGNADAISSVDEYYPECQKLSSGVEGTIMTSAVKGYEYYNLSGQRLAQPVVGINIRRTIFSDGSVKVDKVIKK